MLARIRGERLRVDMRLRALRHGFRILLAHEIGEALVRHRAERRRFVQRIAEHIGVHEIDCALDEAVVVPLVHVDALDAAAALARIEEGAVDEVLDGVVEIGVRAHIGRVLAAELEPERGEGARRCALDGAPAGDGAGEVAVIDEAGAENAARLVVAEIQVLEQALRQAGPVHRHLEALAGQHRLRRVLEQHRIAGHQRRHDGVDGGEIGIVPGRDDEHEADRLALDHAAEARLLVVGWDRLQALLRNRDHVARPLLDPAELAAVAHRAAHLLGDLGHHLLVHGEQRIEEGGDLRSALGNRGVTPCLLRLARGLDRRIDGGLGHDRTADELASVDGGNADDIGIGHKAVSFSNDPLPLAGRGKGWGWHDGTRDQTSQTLYQYHH